MALSQNPELRDSCRTCLSVATSSPRPPLPPSPADLLGGPPLDLSCPPLHEPSLLQPLHPPQHSSPVGTPLSGRKPPSPPHTRSRTAQRQETDSNMLPLREVANGDMGTIRVHVPFPVSDISQIQKQVRFLQSGWPQYSLDSGENWLR